jgi:hypothetical protein
MLAGFEALRRKTVADFPDETWETAGRRWHERYQGATASLRSRHGGASDDDPSEARIRRLERLDELRASGTLSEEELAREKARIIGNEGSTQ